MMLWDIEKAPEEGAAVNKTAEVSDKNVEPDGLINDGIKSIKKIHSNPRDPLTPVTL